MGGPFKKSTRNRRCAITIAREGRGEFLAKREMLIGDTETVFRVVLKSVQALRRLASHKLGRAVALAGPHGVQSGYFKGRSSATQAGLA